MVEQDVHLSRDARADRDQGIEERGRIVRGERHGARQGQGHHSRRAPDPRESSHHTAEDAGAALVDEIRQPSTFFS
jgi:hypothetical protein